MYDIIHCDTPDTTITVAELWSQTTSGTVMSGTSSPFYTSSNGSCAYGKGLENYKARKAAGELLPHLPWNQREWSFTQTSKGQSYTYGSPGKVWWDEWPASHLFAGWSSLDNYPEFPGEPPIELPDADYFVQKSAARIASQGFDSLTFLAELNKTRDMFKNTLKRFVKMSKKSKRKKKRKPDRLESLGSYMSDYLEARYGWRVLAFELDDLYSAVYEFDKKRTRFSERSGYSTTHVVDLSEVIENAETIWTKSWTDTYEISVRGNVSADFSPARWQFNPFVTAWETIPYSFVVDWFVHIGQALEATSFLVFADAYYASTGYHVSVTRDYDVEYVDNPSGSDTGTYYGRVSVRGTGSWTNRTPTSVSFSPLTEIRLDGWKIMDLIALAKDFILPSSGGKPRSFRR